MFKVSKLLSSILLDPEKFVITEITLRENYIETYDELVNLEWASYEGNFYDIGTLDTIQLLHGGAFHP